MSKANKQATTRLAGQPCVNPSCNRAIKPRNTCHLCFGCETHWRWYSTPVAGFIASGDLKYVTKQFLADLKPPNAEAKDALRIVRGTRYREGAWSERPAFRLQPLLHGRWNQRLPHLLVGRRFEPSLKALINAIVHWHLASNIIGTGGQYSHFLAGATHYGRRAPIAPKGDDVLKGNAKSAGYRLSVVDFSAIGQHCLKAGRLLGVHPKDRRVSDKIVSIYAAGVEAGDCHRPVVLPYGSFPTTASGDHPFDHRFSKDSPVPSHLKGAIRRASGLIKKGAWPAGIDLSWEEGECVRRQPKPNPYLTKTTNSTPDVGWIFTQ
jgi:hypothetical protein